MSWLLLSSAALAGLLSGFHCLTMCGGINTALTTTQPLTQCNTRCTANACAKTNMKFSQAYQLYWIHLGRISSYTLLGITAGTLGSSLFWSTTLPHISYYLRLFTGIVMVTLGGYALMIRSGNHKINRFTLLLNKAMTQFANSISTVDSFWIGLCWGLIPCGMIYALLASALTIGNPLISGLFMLSFGLGTLPALLLAGHLSKWLQKHWLRLQHFKHWSSITLIISGVWIFIVGLTPPEQHQHHHHLMMNISHHEHV